MSSKKSLKLGFCELPFNFTPKQEQFIDIMENKNTRIVFLSGVAGTSKSFLSTYVALKLFNMDSRKKIYYLRTVVESAERSLGFLRGDLSEKFGEYSAIFYEKIQQILDDPSCKALYSSQIVEAAPINFMRGRTFEDSVVIFDEASNASAKEMLTILTRIGKYSKIFICGDPKQSDIKNSGFKPFYNCFDNKESRNKGIYCLQFNKEDIVRDDIIGYIIDCSEYLFDGVKIT